MLCPECYKKDKETEMEEEAEYVERTDSVLVEFTCPNCSAVYSGVLFYTGG